MPKSDLQAARSTSASACRSKPDHTIVFAASQRIEDRTGRSIREFVRTARPYHTIEIRAGPHQCCLHGRGGRWGEGPQAVVTWGPAPVRAALRS
jgi:hypothetical protein